MLDFIGSERRAQAIAGKHPGDPALLDFFGGRESISGVSVTPRSALNISAWYAGVRILAETIASLPMFTYRRLEPEGKERATTHPVYRLLHDQPNPFMTNVEFFECQQANILGWGNAFAEIERDGAGRVTALWPIPPAAMRVQVNNGRLWYYAQTQSGPEVQYAAEDILHTRSLSSDGIIGYPIVDLMREPLGLTKAEEEHRARFFKNDARPAGIIEYPGAMGDDAYKRYKTDWQETYGGLGNRYRIAFLEQGLKYHETMFSPEASQFIEGRKFQLEEVARILGIPLILLQSTEKATSWGTGIEQFMLAFLQFTIRPWLKRWEARLNASLFTPREARSFFVEALIEDLLRADIKTRQESYNIAITGGWMTRNEARVRENMNPATGLSKYLVQQNLAEVDEQGNIMPINANKPAAAAA